MAGSPNEGQGDNEQRRAKAKQARDAGKLPSAVGVTTGASKQPKKAPGNASHQEKMELRDEGQESPNTSGKPRPGNRETDPKRTDAWT